MNLYTIALFFHVVGAIGVFVALGLEWVSLRFLRSATTVERVREVMQVSASLRWVGGASMVTILVAGFYMMATVWGDVAWITVALGAIVLLAVFGGALTGPRMAAIGRAIPVEDGPVSVDLHQRLSNPLLWLSLQTRLAITLGIVFLMTVKPELIGSLLTIGVATALGLVSALPSLTRERAGQPAAWPDEVSETRG